jgi:hypothetical protein
VAASVGLSCEGVAPRFIPCLDVSSGGVLLALPALLAAGLLRHTERHFSLPGGYYSLSSIFLLLGFLALARVKSLEQLRYEAPGEWGKLLGLDRVPEVRTLRDKVNHLASTGQPVPWSAALCSDWMTAAPQAAQICYVDGHVRVYHGSQTLLPKHYVSRQRLCLRATVDYWVNAMDGQPFFVISQDIDPGLVSVVRNQLLPRLSAEIPCQPEQEQLTDPTLHRFIVVFDREGYSPSLMSEMWDERIAALTYRKRPGDDWPHEEFSSHAVSLVGGETVTMQLAERGVHLGGSIWVREIRRLTPTGQQTTIVTTWYQGGIAQIAAAMFARWCQENFFAYMRHQYGLDKLAGYGTEKIPDTTPVINPVYRRLDGEVRKGTSRLQRLSAEFGGLGLNGEIEPAKVAAYAMKKAALKEEITALNEDLARLKAERKTVKRHIPFSQLPEDARFERLKVHSKHMVDTIKMVAYRAETAIANTLKELMSRTDDARALLRAIYTTDADLMPDEQAGTLTVRLHNTASHAHDAAVAYLCEELNETETFFPGTDLKMIYQLVSTKTPGDQEV